MHLHEAVAAAATEEEEEEEKGVVGVFVKHEATKRRNTAGEKQKNQEQNICKYMYMYSFCFLKVSAQQKNLQMLSKSKYSDKYRQSTQTILAYNRSGVKIERCRPLRSELGHSS